MCLLDWCLDEIRHPQTQRETASSKQDHTWRKPICLLVVSSSVLVGFHERQSPSDLWHRSRFLTNRTMDVRHRIQLLCKDFVIRTALNISKTSWSPITGISINFTKLQLNSIVIIGYYINRNFDPIHFTQLEAPWELVGLHWLQPAFWTTKKIDKNIWCTVKF